MGSKSRAAKKDKVQAVIKARDEAVEVANKAIDDAREYSKLLIKLLNM